MQQGYSLLELAMVVLIAGLVTMLTLGLLVQVTSRSAEQFDRGLLQQADQAVLGFAFIHDRLPCPDSNGDGFENCSASVGDFPQASVGVALKRGQSLRYSVYRGDNDLSTASNVFNPYLPTTMGTDFSSPRPAFGVGNLNNITGVDFCAKLAGESGGPPSSGRTHITGAGATNNVAYVLAAPGVWDSGGDGSLFDSDNRSGVGFVSPEQAMDAAYDDRVRAIDFAMLWDRLGCGGVMSAAGHAQPNASVAMSILLRSMVEYEEVLDIQMDLVNAGIASGTAGVLMAAAGVAGAAATVATATSQILASKGALSAIMAPAIISVAANAASVVTAAIGLALIEAQKTALESLIDEAGEITAAMNLVNTQIRARSIELDEHGLYLQ